MCWSAKTFKKRAPHTGRGRGSTAGIYCLRSASQKADIRVSAGLVSSEAALLSL